MSTARSAGTSRTGSSRRPVVYETPSTRPSSESKRTENFRGPRRHIGETRRASSSVGLLIQSYNTFAFLEAIEELRNAVQSVEVLYWRVQLRGPRQQLAEDRITLNSIMERFFN